MSLIIIDDYFFSNYNSIIFIQQIITLLTMINDSKVKMLKKTNKIFKISPHTCTIPITLKNAIEMKNPLRAKTNVVNNNNIRK